MQSDTLVRDAAFYKRFFSIWSMLVLYNIITLGVNLADNVMIGAYSEIAMSGVSAVNQIQFVFQQLMMGVGDGIVVLGSQYWGKRRPDAIRKFLPGAFLVGAGISLFLFVAACVAPEAILAIFTPDPAIRAAGVEYLRIIKYSYLIFALSQILLAMLRSVETVRIGFWVSLAALAVNISLNYLLIGGNLGFPELGTRGAAIATVIGSVVGCGMSIASMFSKQSFVFIRGVRGWIASRFDIRSLLNVGTSAFVEQIFMRIGFLLFAITVANLGTTQYAAHQIGMNMMSLSFSFGDGLSVASVALVGRSLGQERRDLAKLYAAMCQRLGLLCAFVMSMVFLFFGRNLFALFSNEPVIMRILCFVIYMQISQVVFFGCLRGAGDTKYTALASLISVTFIRPGLSWLLCYPLGLGLFGVWMGLVGDQFMRFLLGYIRMKQGKWLKIKI